MAEIVERLHIRSAQVANDLKRQGVAPEPPPKVHPVPERIDWVALQLATQQEVLRQAWQQWEASKKPKETRTVVERTNEQGTTITRTIRTAESHGDVKFLNLVLRILKDQARLYEKLTPKPKPVRQPRSKKPKADPAEASESFMTESVPVVAPRTPSEDVLGRMSSLVAGSR